MWLVPKRRHPGRRFDRRPVLRAKFCAIRKADFIKKLTKYIEESGSVKRGIEMLIDCHQNHLAFTPLVSLRERPFSHPMTVELLAAV